MNQGKIWLVVNPSVGLPAFLGGVAIISLCVHTAVLNKTDWYPAIYNGKAKAKVAQVEEAAKPVAQAPTAQQPAMPAATGTVSTVAAVSTAPTGPLR